MVHISKVNVHWGDWLNVSHPDWWSRTLEKKDRKRCLYLYGGRDEDGDFVSYIGEAGHSLVSECLKRHATDERDRIFERMGHEYMLLCDVKIGTIDWYKIGPFSAEHLFDIQTLMIYLEYRENDGHSCWGNKANTRTRDITRPGMVVVNHGYYPPLSYEYHDEH